MSDRRDEYAREPNHCSDQDIQRTNSALLECAANVEQEMHFLPGKHGKSTTVGRYWKIPNWEGWESTCGLYK